MPKKNSPTIAERIEALSFVDEVDALILEEGTTLSDVARYIQRTMMKLRDVSFKALTKVLGERAKMLREEQAEEEADVPDVVMSNLSALHPAMDGPRIHIDESSSNRKIVGDANRTPTTLSRVMYEKYIAGFNSLLETESLFLAQRDRIARMMMLEERLGMPLDDLCKEFDVGRKLLLSHAKIQKDLGLTDDRGGGAELSLSLKLKGLKSKLGADVLETLEDPQSRHKILSALRVISGNPQLPSQIIDGEATDVP